MMVAGASTEEALVAAWIIWLVSWVAVATSRWSSSFWRTRRSPGPQVQIANPELESLVTEIGRLEREAKALCHPDSFVAYAKLERELDEKRRQLEALQRRQQQQQQELVGQRDSATRSWREGLERWLPTLLSLCWLVSSSLLWLFYRNTVVSYFPCYGRAWRWFRFLRLSPVQDGLEHAPSTCALYGGPWIWLCVFVGRRVLHRVPLNLSRRSARP
ncbi:hypothetical protein F1559_004360 [Cyanidiococcus yangmingshanensis]|uniref:Uncharacterized protein n=1 Tax=Cyanidiococcus yangmingshanensis TaxID=2690220 RepID=A0A7J7ILE2_9RHOD|nr:hypothetical protein F1559_004360 [Cyanidiococcus yangmingshanensis]